MDPLAPLRWAASKARSFRYFQQPYLLPSWLRWIGWFAVAWIFYGVFSEVGFRHVYRRYSLSDAELLHPPAATWIGSPADSFGVLSTYQMPADQIFGLLVAVVISGLFVFVIHLRRSLISVGILAIALFALPGVTSLLCLFLGYQFYVVSVHDGLVDPSLDPDVFWVVGTLEKWSATKLPKLSCYLILAGAALTEIHRYWRCKF